MKIHKIKIIGDFDDIIKAARITRGDGNTDREITPHLFEKFIIAEHSPIRVVSLQVIMTVQRSVALQLARHVHADHYIQTSRPDITGSPRSEGEKLYMIQANLQEWLHISRARLCKTAEKDTIDAIMKIKTFLSETGDEYLEIFEKYMQPKCYFTGRCNEVFNPCGDCPQTYFYWTGKQPGWYK